MEAVARLRDGDDVGLLTLAVAQHAAFRRARPVAHAVNVRHAVTFAAPAPSGLAVARLALGAQPGLFAEDRERLVRRVVALFAA